MLQGSIAVNAATALIFIVALCETWWQAEGPVSELADSRGALVANVLPNDL
jgi:hypothetical protein